jgi:hypothetical protein
MKGTAMIAKLKRSACAEFFPVLPVQGAYEGPVGSGSGSSRPPHSLSKMFFPAKEPPPIALRLSLDTPMSGKKSAAGDAAQESTLLIHALDPNFAGCWFSRAIHLSAKRGNPAYWILKKTARDRWHLCLRRARGELVAYELKTRKHSFPLRLEKARTRNTSRQWPATVTISCGD